MKNGKYTGYKVHLPTPAPRQPISADEDRIIKASRKLGYPIDLIAVRLGRSKNTIYNRMQEFDKQLMHKAA